MFYFEKFLSALLTPPGIIIFVLFIVGILSLKKALNPGQKLLAYIELLVAFFLYLLSSGIGTYLYLKPLETDISLPSIESLATGDAIVVLGGGIVLTQQETELSVHSLKRLLKGFELYKTLKIPIIVTGGSPLGRDGPAEAEVMAKVLKEWGIDEEDILVDVSARTTAENAYYVSKIYHENNWSKVILVTSAVHMKRATDAFLQNGVRVISYPTDYLYDYAPISWVDFLPSSDALEANLSGIHEFIGQIWYRTRGR
ncbi:YdcF family protein [Kosmotoga pacifica]|uniref:DUF218 domain-containing protein n=1 Tax=Kosmotoga pacifica TaxID=1330330 RepID=A0A0G2ZBL5_9BACT|nr:YdcF family protein [Kosmotoga pacifica]AKI97466.1 hypothetical protein IX53_06125 [Kosmotoga pacifica]